MCCQLPHWQPCPSRQLLSLSQIHLPPGSFSRSNHQPNSDSFQMGVVWSGAQLPSNPTLEAALSQHLVTVVHPTVYVQP